jgi:hypothetical protein
MIAVVVAGCLALVGAVRFLAPSAFVARVEVENRSEYAIDVSVADGSGNGPTALGAAQPKRTTTFEDVYDVGRTWVFSFTHAGLEESITMSRPQLDTSGWRVSVPPDLIGRLHLAHVPPTPVFAGP